MDNLETLSDHSDQDSSSCSSLSAVSGFEDELLEIRSLIAASPRPLKLKSESIHSDINHADFYQYENRIRNLTAELENTNQINNKLKSEILELHRKYELENHTKFEKLLSTNKELQVQLNLAKGHIKNLEENGRNICDSEKLTSLEKSKYDLSLQINVLQKDLKHWKNLAIEFEQDNKKLKVHSQEEKCLLETKSNAVEALKKVITELHLQLQNLIQSNIQTNNDLAIKENEIEALKNSKIWYENQLHLCREEKNQLFEERVKLNAQILLMTTDLNNTKHEFNNYKNKSQELIQKASKDKTELENKLNRFSINQKDKKIIIGDCLEQNFESTLHHYQDIIKDLKLEVESVKGEISAQQLHFESIKKQNSDLILLNTVIQKKLSEKQYENENMQLETKNLETNLDSLKKQMNKKEQLLIELTTENAQYQTTLKTLSDEKKEVETVVSFIRENFDKLLTKFNHLKSELHEKELIISKMHSENHKMFMSNNWRVQELEKLQIDNKKFNNLEETIDKVKLKEQIVIQENNRLTKQVSELQKRIEKVNTEKVNLLGKLSSIEEVNKKLTEERKKEQNLYLSKTNLLNNEIENLNNEVGNLETLMTNFKAERDELEKEKETVSKAAADLQKTVEKLMVEKEFFENNNEISLKDKNYNPKGITKVDFLKKTTEELNPSITKNDNFNTLLTKLTTLIKYVINNDNVWEVHDFISKDLLQSNDLLRGLLESISAVQKIKTNLVSKNIRYEKFIMLIIEKLQSGSQEADEKYKILLERQSTLESKLKSMTNLCKELTESMKNKSVSQNNSRTVITNEKDIQTIENLNILLQAKELELKEKQKKYESNYRTLIRKVKEHMRGRRNAEKHCSYLQELYNNVFDELNTFKLKFSTSEYELQNTKYNCENYKTTNEKLKGKLIELQSRQANGCENCEELKKLLEEKQNSLQNINRIVEEKGKQLQMYKTLELEYEKTLQWKEELQKQLKDEERNNEKLTTELSDRNKLVEFLEESLTSLKNLFTEVTEKLVKEQENHIQTRKERDDATEELNCQKEQNEITTDKINNLSCKLNQTEGELSYLRTQRQNDECNWNRKESEMQNLINLLRNESVFLKNDLQVIKNEQALSKSFSSELKVALDATVRQNKMLKEQVAKLSRQNSSGKSSLFELISTFPVPSKCDEKYINELLRRNNSPLPNPFPELNSSLASLKEEVIGLRKQITEKNSFEKR